MGASLLSAVGIQNEWLAHSLEEYISIAVSASQDLERLANTRAGLRERMLASRLCDGQGFVQGLEETYRQLWRRWLQKPPEASL